MKNDGLTGTEKLLHSLHGEETDAFVAYRKLYDLFAPKIFRAANKFLRDEVMAEDLVQDVFLSVWQRRQQLHHVERFERYLYGMVKKQAAKAITRKLRFDAARIEFAERTHLPETEDHQVHYEMKLNKLVDELPEQRRTIFRLAKFEGLSYEAIAKQLGISIHTVNHNITKAFKFMETRKHDIISVLVVALTRLF